MSILGIADMKQFALPAGFDAGELEKYRTADGVTYEDIVNDILAGLQIVGSELASHPQYGTLVNFTTELGFEYSNGATDRGMEERTEYRTADPKRGATIGHMLPMAGLDRALAWTWDFLDVARRVQIDTDISDAMDDVETEFQYQVLNRFFSDTEESIATSGVSMPLVNGSANFLYTPRAYNGKTFDSSHTHFARDTTGNRKVAIDAGVLHLREHGIMPPYYGVIPENQYDSYAALSNFIKPERNIEHFQGATDVRTAAIDEEMFVGALETKYGVVYLWETPRITSDHMGIYKHFGNDDQRNPVAVRYKESRGRGPIMLSGGSFRQYPLENVSIIHDYGVGIEGAGRMARLNGYCIRFAASGNYAAPTISK